MRRIAWIVTVPLGVAIVLFAVANRQDVILNFWPLPFTLELPLFVIILAVLVLGFLIGGFVAWLSGHRWRKAARAERRRAEALEQELSLLRRQTTPAADSGTELAPAVPAHRPAAGT